MNEKENALEILRFGHPDHLTMGVPTFDVSYTGCDHQGFSGGGDDSPAGTRWTDIWGTEWHKELPGVMGFPRGFPLAEVRALKSYAWPDPDDERICGKIYQMAKEFPGGDFFLAGSNRDTLWEKSYMLVGMETMMVYFYEEPTYVREIFHRIMDFQLGIAAHYVNIGVELVGFSDDLGTQRAPLLSPRMVSEFFLPEYKRLIQFYKQHQVLISFHSCGHIEPFIPLFIELGIDILHPIQATANNLDRVRAATLNKIALSGGVSSATVMDGPVEKIRREVHDRIAQLGQNGGYFCHADQGLPFPPEHVEALQTAINDFNPYHP